jgi:hypothetical protein
MTPTQLQAWRWRMDAATKPPFRVLLRVRPSGGGCPYVMCPDGGVLHRSHDGNWRLVSALVRRWSGYPQARA